MEKETADDNMIGIPPRLLPTSKLPCGYDRNKHSFGHRLKHYRACQHPYCQWRAAEADEIAQRMEGVSD